MVLLSHIRRPPLLLARQRAGLTGKESERETAPAAAWPVPAPRPPSPCRRERAGSAGPPGYGPIGRGGPQGPGPVPPPRATPPPFNRRRRWPATPPAPRPQATPASPRSSQVPRPPLPPCSRSSSATRSFSQILSRFFSPPATPPGCFHRNNVWDMFPGRFKNNGQC